MVAWKQVRRVLVLSLLVVGSSTAIATALQSSSTSYGVDETFFGSGGELNACSTTYCSQQTAGESAVGNSKSSSYQVQAGSTVTDRDTYLQFIVNTTNTNLGVLNSATTAYTTATFSVKTYLAGGYSVVNNSPGPQNGSHVLLPLSTPSGSSIGNEQFGINLVANTTGCGAPANFGANIAQNPDSTFSFGQVGTGYGTCGLFKYSNGEQIAYSNTSSGETDYTISYIFNISNLTPGGTYTLQHNLVATSTF